MMSVSVNSPRVKVPVLSNTTVDNFPARSSDSVFRKRMPRCAPMPVPTITAVGVASPNAHGHAITNTATNRSIAGVKPSPTKSHHVRNVTKAIPMTTGTNTLATASAMRWMGALLCCVACTSWMRRARAVSEPTRVASIVSRPLWLIVAAVTAEPAVLSTGRLSPVKMLSSTALSPSRTTPSTGMLSPGRTRSLSPIVTCAIGRCCSSPFFKRHAVFGDSPSSFLRAALVCPFARASSSLPNLINVIITAAVSK